MGKLERITVTMPEEMAAKLRAAVDAGAYATTSEVIREALRHWGDKQERRAAELERLREMIAEGQAGPFLDGETALTDLRDYVAALVGKTGADQGV